MAIEKDKVLELFGRYWGIAYNEGRTGEGLPDLANDVLAELHDALNADDGDMSTAELVEIDGHAYGLRPGAARVVREAMRDAGRYRWLRGTRFASFVRNTCREFVLTPPERFDWSAPDSVIDAGIDADMANSAIRTASDGARAAMAKDGAP